MSHAFVGVLTCARIHSIELDRKWYESFNLSVDSDVDITADEGGATRMSGGISWLTLPAGYLGSSLIGACLIACGFNTNASKVASLVMAVFFLFTLWWARKNLLCVLHSPFAPTMTYSQGLQVLGPYPRHVRTDRPILVRCWRCCITILRTLHWRHVVYVRRLGCHRLVHSPSIAVLQVTNRLATDDTLARKVNTSDASEFARICGCCPSRGTFLHLVFISLNHFLTLCAVWGFIWLIQAIIFFGLGVIVGLVAFKVCSRRINISTNELTESFSSKI